MKIINNIFNSDLVFNLKREEHTVHSGENGEVGVSGRDYALVPAEMWVQALRWPNSSNSKVFSEHCPHSALWALDYPRGKDGARLQMRLSYCPAANFFSFLSGELTVTLLGPLVCSEFLFIWSLENNNFSGTVPPELGKLVNLNNLRISSNNFTGRIPDFIQSLKQLQKLGADILLLQQICKHQDDS